MEAARTEARSARQGQHRQEREQQRGRARLIARRARRRRRLGAAIVLTIGLGAAFVLAARGPGGHPAPTKGPLLLNEEFEGDSLDTDRWSPCYWWATDGCTNLSNRNLQWYVPEQVDVDRGRLLLEARPRRVEGVEGRTFDYVSGLVSGLSPDRTLFAFRYGYVEARVRIPEGTGLWPALWMLPTTRSSLPEVDIFEIVGEEPDVLQMHTHWEEDGEARQQGKKWQGPNFSEGSHTFGLQWTPDELTWYVDGAVRWQVTDPEKIPHEDMYLIVNLAVGGEYTKRPTADTKFPAVLEVDYVKVWGEE
jgi:beta-glucanase (GH16 family)